ncbi:MAG TPA: alpha-L-arabinofuranosidase C-terminal domain-containing protein [Candidatus Acidoferrales bacterium]|jgi:alpha-N-arabinofuranosidase|nr:alpha-L-arabinofuranosidase C-terminal domain-containing protein [Candidatus Acidoferrales bacterium]
MIGRRDFLRTGFASAGCLLAARTYSPFAWADTKSLASRIEVLTGEPLGIISPNLYGHFTENLSGVIYDGVWVGANSKVPNIDGIRKELIDEMKKIKAPVVRFPGGCFADSYDWRDGVGPLDKRPRRTNFWAPGETSAAPASHRYDPNEFGTNEFAHFCKLIGSEPYLAANLRSLPAAEFYRWIEYCNSPAGSTSLAEIRAAGGFKDPFNVRFWGVGNESWGCGGNFTAQEYAVEFRRFATWVPRFGQEISFIGSGPNVDDWAWTRGFFEEIVRKGRGRLREVYGWALHHYAWNLSRGRTRDWVQGKGDALNFDSVDWYELLKEGDRMEGLINGHWQVMGEEDPDHGVKLVVDEWGPWYKPGSEATPGDQLEQMPTLRDAVFSAMTLDTFNRNPEKIAMANCAQLINCLNSLYLAHEDRFVVTPVGHVFAMFAAHQGGQGLRTIFSAPTIDYDRDGKPASFWGLRGSASLHDKELTVTVVNPSVSDARDAEIVIRGATVKSGSATVLTNSDIHAHNTFAAKDVVVPETKNVDIKGAALNYVFPPASVTKLSLTLL